MPLTRLMIAAQKGDTVLLRRYLAENQAQTNDGRTALMLAASQGHLDCILTLLKYEARLQDSRGWTALFFAVASQKVTCIPVLLRSERGIQNASSETALMFAVVQGLTRCVRTLLDEAGCQARHPIRVSINGSTIKLPKGSTALMLASCLGNVEGVRLLCSREAKVQNQEGWTALMYAAKYGHEKILTLLKMEEGLYDNEGYTALHHAIDSHQEGCIRQLLTELAVPTINGLTEADVLLSTGQTETLSQVLESIGAGDVIAGALQTSHEPSVRFALERSMQMIMPNAKERRWSLLMWAVVIQKGECLPYLRADIRKQDIDGETALMKAVEKGCDNFVRELAEDEGGLCTVAGWTALMFAAQRGETSYIPLLLTREVRLQNVKGRTALMIAALNGQESVVEELRMYEGDMVDNDGRTASHYARLGGHNDIVKLLEEGPNTLDGRSLKEDETEEKTYCTPPSLISSPSLKSMHVITHLQYVQHWLEKEKSASFKFAAHSLLESIHYIKKAMDETNAIEVNSIEPRLKVIDQESDDHIELSFALRKAKRLASFYQERYEELQRTSRIPPAIVDMAEYTLPELETIEKNATLTRDAAISAIASLQASSCVICQVHRRNVLALPCTHLCLCTECSVVSTTCPVCAQPVTDYKEVLF